ncbi:MAG: P1 family peptidase [Anaerovoracaceae bacterium]|jgi:L-aminopeptidase/D-esterase-like protein
MKEIKITDIKGIRIGHAQDPVGGTGCTAILCDKGATASGDVRGGGPASRETEMLRPEKTVEQIHGIMLSGGSAYGLAAGDGALAYLEEKGIGFDAGCGIVPLVCGASCFDLEVADPKARPTKEMGYAACVASESGEEPAQGNVGAGTAATVGKFFGTDYMMKSGLGIYAVQVGNIQVGALVVVNALGDVIDYDTRKPLAGLLTPDKKSIGSTVEAMYREIGKERNVYTDAGTVTNTTLGCLITNARITKTQAYKLAQLTHNGCAQVIRPVHTSADGDSIFVLATGEAEAAPDGLGALATEVMARAINRAVLKAEHAYGLKTAADFAE